MKCIHCETNSKLKERADRKCPKCGHAFAFEPTQDVLKVTDPLFHGAIQAVSLKGTLFFTRKQLYWELCRFLEKKSLPGCALGKKKGPDATIKAPKVSYSDFVSNYLNRWVSIHGRPEKLVGLEKSRSVAAPIPTELENYSFDRALIVEDAEIAAMLVKNRFHFENNCAILSLDRRFPAPETLQMVLGMLQRNPNLAVFALHDCSDAGLGMSGELRSPEWFPDLSVRIYDLGLRFEQLPARGLLGVAGVVELSSLRPGKLMKSAYLGFSQASQYSSGDAWIDSGYGYYYIGDSYPIWGGDSVTGGMDSGSYDSFG